MADLSKLQNAANAVIAALEAERTANAALHAQIASAAAEQATIDAEVAKLEAALAAGTVATSNGVAVGTPAH